VLLGYLNISPPSPDGMKIVVAYSKKEGWNMTSMEIFLNPVLTHKPQPGSN
jgi:hypothetical protein